MSPFPKYASVILDVSLDKTLDYGIPSEFIEKAARGVRVEVPIKGHIKKGTISAIKEKPDFTPVQPISNLLSDSPVITEDLFELASWISKYYFCSESDAMQMMLPPGIKKTMQPKLQLFVMRKKTRDELISLCKEVREKAPSQALILEIMLQVKKGILLTELLEKAKANRSSVEALVKKGWLEIDQLRIDRSPLIDEEYLRTKPKVLSEEQKSALQKITKSIDDKVFQTHLLHGVTGSGKTEVYLQAIDHALKDEKGTIMLVPEISLTAQTIERFRSRFDDKIAILHHRLSDGERMDEWNKILRKEARIVIGARSAIFCPIPNLGLIIVDEEHEQSYKQNDRSPCYQARDVAVMRGKLTQASVVLGSATPSIESYFNAKSGKYTLSKLNARADRAQMPDVKIVDMKFECDKAKRLTSFSDSLLEGIKKRVANGEQAILFLNRRGYHTTLFCNDCRQAVNCKHCDVALTFHLGDNTLACHLCGYSISPPPKQCPSCKSFNPMKYKGVGTEQVEKALHAILPEVRTIRLDADTTKHKGSHQKLLREFGTGKADVLIGTQMIAKGLHFPEVTLVGVLNSDVNLNIPDFRASETAFQLITQVAGRAGRGTIPGEVIIQTSMPDNMTIKQAAAQEFEAFYESEIGVRQLFAYPPFKQMAKITFSGINQKLVLETGDKVRQFLIQQLPQDYHVHPVIAAGHAKVKDKYRYQFLIRGPSVYPINQALKIHQQKKRLPSSIRMHVDINPSSTFF